MIILNCCDRRKKNFQDALHHLLACCDSSSFTLNVMIDRVIHVRRSIICRWRDMSIRYLGYSRSRGIFSHERSGESSLPSRLEVGNKKCFI